MNIALFADCYRPTVSGVVTSLVQLRDGLRRLGHRAVVVAVTTPPYREQEAGVYLFPSLPFNRASQFRLALVSQRAVNEIVRRERIDVVHSHTEFSVGWAARRAARAADLPLVHTVHTMYEEYRHYLFFGRLLPAGLVRGYLARFLVGCDAVVCPSPKAQDYLQAIVPHARTTIIGNGLDRRRFAPRPAAGTERERIRRELGIGPGDRVILYAGRLGREKRTQELFRALVPLLLGHPPYKALFVGCGPGRRTLVRAVAEANLGSQVVVTGPLSWERMPGLYAIADVFATASLSEVHPLTLIEAATAGLPIVARRDAATAGLVRDGVSGYLVDTDRQVGERLAELLDDGARLRRFAHNARLLSRQFDLESQARRLEALYREVSCATGKRQNWGLDSRPGI